MLQMFFRSVSALALAVLIVCRAHSQAPAEAPVPVNPSAPAPHDEQPLQLPPLPSDKQNQPPVPTVSQPATPSEGDANSMTFPTMRGGGGRLGNMMGGTVGNLTPYSDFRITWLPPEKVAFQNTHLGYQQYDFSMSCPIWQDSSNEWSASGHLQGEFFHTSAILPDTLQRFPDELWNFHLGTSYRHLFDNGWIGGASINVGTASDQPFSTINETTLSATGFLRVPQGEHNAWLFTLNLSTNSEVLPGLPIPGVAYFYAPTEWFQATVGFPFASVVYRPFDDLTLQLSYAFVTNVHAKATYRLARPLHIYAAFDWDNENYFLANRLDDRDRFFYYSKRLTGGLRYSLSPNASLDFSTGYVFDRFYFEGHNVNAHQFNRIDIGDGPVAAFQLNLRF
jgi:hypothetical protein